MKIVISRQKQFDDNNSHTGLKVAGALATTGALVAGAKKGYLGGKAMKSVNKAWGQTGKALGINSMMQSGARGAAIAEANMAHGTMQSGKKVSADWAKKYQESLNANRKDLGLATSAEKKAAAAKNITKKDANATKPKQQTQQKQQQPAKPRTAEEIAAEQKKAAEMQEKIAKEGRGFENVSAEQIKAAQAEAAQAAKDAEARFKVAAEKNGWKVDWNNPNSVKSQMSKRQGQFSLPSILDPEPEVGVRYISRW